MQASLKELLFQFFNLLADFDSCIRRESFQNVNGQKVNLDLIFPQIINYISLNSAETEDDLSDSFLLLLRAIAFIPQYPASSCRLFLHLTWKREMMQIFFQKLAILRIISPKYLEFLQSSTSLPMISREEKIHLSKLKVQQSQLDAQLMEQFKNNQNEEEIYFDRKFLLRILENEYRIVMDSYAKMLMEIQVTSLKGSSDSFHETGIPQKGRNLPFGNSPFVILPAGSGVNESREMIKDKVFRSSHRLPSLTIDEFLELERKKGAILDSKPTDSSAKNENEEISIDLYDCEEVYRQRKFDEFKDDNRRGSGNRMGKS